MSGFMAGRAFLCGATCAALQHQHRAHVPRKHSFPVMCEAPAVQHRPLNIPRSAFIRKNTHAATSEYELGEAIIGEGAYSTVIKGRNRYSGVTRAIKVIPKSNTDAEHFEVELKTLMALDHPHIVKILQYFEEGENFYIVFELINGPDLVQHIIERACAIECWVPEEELSIILRQVLKAILACHDRGIIHRDVKLENFMITGEDMTVKMIDLGLASVSKKDDTKGAADSMQPVDKLMMGTYRYMAPEMYGTKGYDKAVDMWSLGVGFYTMLTLETLLPDDREGVKSALSKPKHVETRIKSCKMLKERKLSKEARDFLTKLLTYDPKKRITAEEALQHPFIQRQYNPNFKKRVNHEVVTNLEAFAKSPRLKRVALLAIAHTISQRPDEELLEVRLMFRALNQSGNGKLSIEELEEGLKRAELPVPANLRDLFAACCSSGDATLSFNEFIACNLPESFVNARLCETVFRLLDRAGDDVLGPEDFKIMYASCGVDVPEVCDSIVQEATGKTSLTLAEFVRFVLKSE